MSSVYTADGGGTKKKSPYVIAMEKQQKERAAAEQKATVSTPASTPTIQSDSNVKKVSTPTPKSTPTPPPTQPKKQPETPDRLDKLAQNTGGANTPTAQGDGGYEQAMLREQERKATERETRDAINQARVAKDASVTTSKPSYVPTTPKQAEQVKMPTEPTTDKVQADIDKAQEQFSKETAKIEQERDTKQQQIDEQTKQLQEQADKQSKEQAAMVSAIEKQIAEYNTQIQDAIAENKEYQLKQEQAMQDLLDYVQQPNPHLDELLNMEFDYDPLTDPEYIRASYGLENQVAQMMVGRGGLYSSVASSALQSGLTSLQVDYSSQARNRFMEERNFKFQMAQFEEQKRGNYFNQVLSVKEQSDKAMQDMYNKTLQQIEFSTSASQTALQNRMAVDSADYERNVNLITMQERQAQQKWENQYNTLVTDFNQKFQIAEFKFKEQQTAYENAFREAQFNQQQIDNAIAREMQREQHLLNVATHNFNMEQQQTAYQMEQNIGKLENDFAFWSEYESNFDRINDEWSKQGWSGATSEVVQYYNDLGIPVRYGTRMSDYPNVENRAYSVLSEWEGTLRDRAFDLNQGRTIMEMINEVKNPTAQQQMMDVSRTEKTMPGYDNPDVTTTYKYQQPMGVASTSSSRVTTPSTKYQPQ